MNINSIDNNNEKMKEIPEWTKKYAESKTIPVIISFIVFVMLYLSVGGASLLTVWSLIKGKMLLFGFAVILDLLLISVVIYLSVPKWGVNFYQSLGQKYFYSKDGYIKAKIERPTVSKKDIIYCSSNIWTLYFN